MYVCDKGVFLPPCSNKNMIPYKIQPLASGAPTIRHSTSGHTALILNGRMLNAHKTLKDNFAEVHPY